jgi:hypothetical protein
MACDSATTVMGSTTMVSGALPLVTGQNRLSDSHVYRRGAGGTN